MVLEGASSYGATEEGGGGGGLPLLHSDPRVEGGPAAANSGCVKAAAAVALSVFAVGCIVVAVVSVSSSLPGGWPLEKRAAGLNRSPFAHNGIPTPEMPALSTVDPKDSGFPYTDRPETSRPSNVWGRWLNRETFPKAGLATNAWWQNIVLGFPSQQGAANKVVALPYTLDASGTVPGLRVHFPRVNPANDRIVQTEFDWRHALQLGSVEPVGTHMVDEPGPLSVTLVWETPGNDTVGEMRSPIVRGSPYITMEYSSLRPMVMSRQEITKMIVDGKKEVHCGGSGSTVHIEREAELVFSGAVSSDYTWLLFVSEPMDMKCSMEFLQERGEGPTPGAPGEMRSMPHFKLAAESVYETAVLRTALVNNCTMGTNLGNCEGKAQGRNQTEYAQILRENYMLYPTGESRVGYESSGLNWAYHEIRDTKHRQRNDDEGSTWGPLGSALSTKELKGPREDGSLYFMWGTRRMDGQIVQPAAEKDDLLMFSLPHHREALSDAKLLPVGTPTLHGFAQLVKGVHWAMSLDLAAVSFGIQRDDLHQPAMTTAINEALDKDIMFEIPDNYKRAAGDTYFSGKMLAKLGRIALIADALGRHDEAMAAAKRLTDAIDVWYDGTAEAPLLYDFRWGGIVSCGCDYKGSGDNGTCANSVGAHECPGLSDPGSNFGAGFYNDQHFHYGYHIYAAAAAAVFYPEWAIQRWESVLMLIRNIANPSPLDTYFPLFRHKDWFLGSSWALGIPTLGGVPYMNGRNQESSSEAVNAYHGIALYGHYMAQIFAERHMAAKAEVASLVRDTGRMLMSTEVRSAKAYWQVRDPGSPGVARVYPPGYKPHVVGMMWSEMIQTQTWFGSELWKVYGIQMLPITAASIELFAPVWIEQMLPEFEESCNIDRACTEQGWSTLVSVAKAVNGSWEQAWSEIAALPDEAFEGPGGDGHSRSSTLWFISSVPTERQPEKEG